MCSFYVCVFFPRSLIPFGNISDRIHTISFMWPNGVILHTICATGHAGTILGRFGPACRKVISISPVAYILWKITHQLLGLFGMTLVWYWHQDQMFFEATAPNSWWNYEEDAIANAVMNSVVMKHCKQFQNLVNKQKSVKKENSQ